VALQKRSHIARSRRAAGQRSELEAPGEPAASERKEPRHEPRVVFPHRQMPGTFGMDVPQELEERQRQEEISERAGVVKESQDSGPFS
jgi:hypothetical protein